MAAVNPPSYLQGGAYQASGDRKLLAALLLGDGPSTVDAGILPWGRLGGFAVTPSPTANAGAWVAPGALVIPDSSGGAYVGINDGPFFVPVNSANVSNDRVDTIVARINDSEVSGGSDSFTIEVVTGTPATSPVAPLQPALSLALADIRIVKGTSTIVQGTHITDRRRATSLRGAVTAGPSTARPAPRIPGQHFYDTDVDDMYEVTAALQWRRRTPQLDQWGTRTIAINNAISAVSVVTFPVPFEVTPVVTTQVVSTAGASIGSTVLAQSVTTTSVALRLQLSGVGTVSPTVHWRAVA